MEFLVYFIGEVSESLGVFFHLHALALFDFPLLVLATHLLEDKLGLLVALQVVSSVRLSRLQVVVYVFNIVRLEFFVKFTLNSTHEQVVTLSNAEFRLEYILICIDVLRFYMLNAWI